MDNKIAAIILAAGKGVRMKSELPKVLHELQGKPLVSHVIGSVRDSGIGKIVVVVGYEGDKVIAATPGVEHVWQREQKGTGHAVMQAEKALEGFDGLVLVACGDVPLISTGTIREMLREASAPSVGGVVLSMVPGSPKGYGRVLKDARGNFDRIVEEKDATENEKQIREVNTGTYVFRKDCLFEGLKTINTNNAQGEYYLPDVFAYIKSSGLVARTVQLADAVEGSGINSLEELELLENRLRKA